MGVNMIFLWCAALIQFCVHLLRSDSIRAMSPLIALADVPSSFIRGSSLGWSPSNMFKICIRFDTALSGVHFRIGFGIYVVVQFLRYL